MPRARLTAGTAAPSPPLLIWVDLDADAALLAHGAGWLSPAERHRVERFATPQLRARALGARVFLRAVLARATRRPPGALLLQQGTRGKPLLRGGPCFNLSHSGQIAILALHPDRPVGVDVELALRRGAETGLPGILTKTEIDAPPRTPTEWLRLWVRKEAVAKAQGLGLHADLAGIATGFAPAKGWRPIPGSTEVLFDADLPGGHPLAVAMTCPRCPEAPPPLTRCDAEALIELGAAL